MAYNRYQGSTGRARRVETEPPDPPRPPSVPEPEHIPPPPPPASHEYRSGPLNGVLGRLEAEDWLVAAILYLAYRSSGDWEMLAALGIYLIL